MNLNPQSRKKKGSGTKLGIESKENFRIKRSSPKHNFGPGAVKLPHSGVETQNNYQETKETRVAKSDSDSDSEAGEAAGETKETQVTKSETKTVSPLHETNLNVLIIVAGGLAWFLFR